MSRLLISALLLASINIQALTLEVITDQPAQVRDVALLRKQGMTINVYDLTAGERKAQDLAKGLTGPDQHAHHQLQQRIAAIGRKQFELQLKTAYQAVIKSVEYQLDRYPAVVFNQGEVVVYGVTDLTQAVGYYRQWLSKQ
jgi:integrating conjugative element protein (TIGR03757 family)